VPPVWVSDALVPQVGAAGLALVASGAALVSAAAPAGP
jgi:hypothetical protein